MCFFDFHTHTPKPDALVSCSPDAFFPLPNLTYSVGIHPWTQTDSYKLQEELLWQHACHPQVLAIGEAGLDRLVGGPMEGQIDVFCRQARMAEELQKPMVLHAVRTTGELIALRKRLRPAVKWVIHGFRGNQHVAESCVDAGFYLSYGTRYQLEALMATPLCRLLLETDEAVCPVEQVYRQVAADLGIAIERLEKQVAENVQSIIF